MTNTTNNTNKTTKREYLAMLMEVVKQSNSENTNILLDFINHEVELLKRKAEYSANRKKKSDENATRYKNMIIEHMASLTEPVTVTEFMRAYGELYIKEDGTPFTNQKFSSLFSALIKEGTLIKEYDKRTALYSLAR